MTGDDWRAGHLVWVWVGGTGGEWCPGRVLRVNGDADLVVRYLTRDDQLGTVTVPARLVWPLGREQSELDQVLDRIDRMPDPDWPARDQHPGQTWPPGQRGRHSDNGGDGHD